MKRKCAKIRFLKTARSMKMKENKEWILITFKAATERCFLKTATASFQKYMESNLKALSLKSICEGTSLNGSFLTFLTAYKFHVK